LHWVVRFGRRGVADEDDDRLGLMGELAVEPFVGVLVAQDPAAAWQWNTTGSMPAAPAGRMIRIPTRPVGPPLMTRSSMSAGCSSTGTLVWTCRSVWRASLGDSSCRGGLPALAAATLASHCSVCGSMTGVKAAGRLAVVEVMAVLP